MKPSHVRIRIMKDHEALRQLLIELEDAVAAMCADESRTSSVGTLARAVLGTLTRHTELEDAILAPALIEMDAWGQVRADQLLTHHLSQRAQIRELTQFYEMNMVPAEVARMSQELIRDLRADMDHEERDILSVDLLRDNVVSVSSECG